MAGGRSLLPAAGERPQLAVSPRRPALRDRGLRPGIARARPWAPAPCPRRAQLPRTRTTMSATGASGAEPYASPCRYSHPRARRLAMARILAGLFDNRGDAER